MTFTIAPIDGVLRKPMPRFTDTRGWLVEIFRQDELPADLEPAMAYVSSTDPGVTRGPHEHCGQTDYFCFLGPFRVFLWDNRPASPTYRHREVICFDEDVPMLIVVPPGVVHAYQNHGTMAALVINCPNRLYRGPGRAEAVDEIRHEDDPASPFVIDW